ncbi:Iron uptake protein A1 precursor [Pseudooceanicola marinus]|uniref:Iron uptake protein A1 n=1 Tax=Pseudooceanicola marinus TaxID=396013 RepID=A0A1X7A9L6_9RHOB|nr:extracellular solute-binding protein [Pseudooceanicola marinus]PJE25616.1 iron ABC transporter substrate-binding protein [Pseudooceanicola marinus]SLN73929.1 Iron uptake protein A1 precursor [Pseudooceanicola marinus]
MRKLLERTAALGLCLLSAVSAQAQTNWSELTDQAREEGSLVVYHSQLGAEHFIDFVKTFEEETGIKVELLDGRASETAERVRSESASGKGKGDLLITSDAVLMGLEAEELLQPHGDLPNLANLREGFVPTDNSIPVFVQSYGILVNTDQVAPEDYPKEWTDLLDPKWKGQIISNDPRAIGVGLASLGPLYETYGSDFLEGLAKQDITFSRNIRLEERRVAQGEFAINLAQVFSFAISEYEGLPVTLVVPGPSVPYTPMSAAVLRDADHVAAAKLFLNAYLSDQAQLLYANVGLIPVVEGVVEQADPEVRDFVGVDLMGWIGPENRGPAVAEMKRVFGE